MDQFDYVADGAHDEEAHPDCLTDFEEFAAVRWMFVREGGLGCRGGGKGGEGKKVGGGRRIIGMGFKEGTHALYTCSGRRCRL